MIAVSLLITFLYLLLIGGFIYGFDQVSEFKYKETSTKTKFSVIVPFRNEAKNLPTLLNSISKLEYPFPNFEIIFVNDASEDASCQIIKNHLMSSDVDFKILQNKRKSKSPKKDALPLVAFRFLV